MEDYLPYGTNGDLVPEMAHAGEGYNFHVTGLTHDERGYPNMTPQVQDKLVRRLQNKIRDAVDRISLFEEEGLDDADVVVVSYGITSRVAQRAIEMAREQGLRVGKLRLITAWPFPEKKIRELAAPRQSLRGARTQSRPDGARSGARRRQGRPRRLPFRTPAAACIVPKTFSKAIVEAADVRQF